MNKKNWKLFLTFGAIIVLAGLGTIFLLDTNKDHLAVKEETTGDVAGAVSDDSTDYIVKLATDLRDKGAVLYGSSSSAETKEQKKLFGAAGIKNLDYVDCDTSATVSNADECIGQGIDIYPTWMYQGKKYTGVQSLSSLAKMVNFEE